MRKSVWLRLLSAVLCGGLLIPAVCAADEPEVKNVVIDAPAESWSMYDRSDNISDFRMASRHRRALIMWSWRLRKGAGAFRIK